MAHNAVLGMLGPSWRTSLKSSTHRPIGCLEAPGVWKANTQHSGGFQHSHPSLAGGREGEREKGKEGEREKERGGGERENARAFTTTVLIKISAHGCIQ